MPERRSSRAKKSITYSGLDDLSDDDFADTTPPPPKKQRAEKIANKKESNKEQDVSFCKTMADISGAESARKRRVPLSEKIYERELQQALEMSMVQSQNSQECILAPAEMEEKREKNATTAPILNHIPGVIVDEEIELLEEVTEKQAGCVSNRPLRTRSNDTKDKHRDAPRLRPQADHENDDDDDYACNEESDEDSDLEEELSEDDSDFDSKATKKKKTPRKDTSKNSKSNRKDPVAKAVTPDNKSHVPAKPSGRLVSVKGSTVQKTNKPSTQPLASSHSTPSSLTSSWKPPAFASSNSSKLCTVRSPTSGLRLGLSRNQKVKPLHPSVHVT
ncbi:rad51 associated protein 1 [Plakobranchus ocellatus]|uniref:Rad51 associated protein 1 n=1 Tax=Plakobranchus ocellatus TaxID=259542 RepID=A0AAV4CT56_9GAST|nr:rad51 associated protein 1 [Plakobranchus ocellatus]